MQLSQSRWHDTCDKPCGCPILRLPVNLQRAKVRARQQKQDLVYTNTTDAPAAAHTMRTAPHERCKSLWQLRDWPRSHGVRMPIQVKEAAAAQS